MAALNFLTGLVGVIGIIALAIYLFGIPPELKRKLERQALKTMGENKLSYLAKDQISKVPTSDQKDVKNLQKGLGNALGGLTNNPIGEATGQAVSQAWGTMQTSSKSALQHVSSAATTAMNATPRKKNEKTDETTDDTHGTAQEQ